MPIGGSDQFSNSHHIEAQRQSGYRPKGVCNQIREISVIEISRTCVEVFGDALPRDRRREALPIDVIHRFLALDRVKPPVRKRHESTDSDQGFDYLFVAIKWIA